MKKFSLLFVIFIFMFLSSTEGKKHPNYDIHAFQILNEYGYPLKDTEISIELKDTYNFKTDNEGYIQFSKNYQIMFEGKDISLYTKNKDKILMTFIPYNSSLESVILGEFVSPNKTREIPAWTTVSTKYKATKDVVVNKMPVIKGLSASIKISASSSYSMSSSLTFLGITGNRTYGKGMGVIQGVNEPKNNPAMGYMYCKAPMKFYEKVQVAPNGQRRTVTFTDHKFTNLYAEVKPVSAYSSRGKYMQLQLTKKNKVGEHVYYSQEKNYTFANSYSGLFGFNFVAKAGSGVVKQYNLVDGSKKYNYKIYDESVVKQS